MTVDSPPSGPGACRAALGAEALGSPPSPSSPAPPTVNPLQAGTASVSVQGPCAHVASMPLPAARSVLPDSSAIRKQDALLSCPGAQRVHKQ